MPPADMDHSRASDQDVPALRRRYRYLRRRLSELSWTLAELEEQISGLEQELAQPGTTGVAERLLALRNLQAQLRARALEELLQVEQLAEQLAGL